MKPLALLGVLAALALSGAASANSKGPSDGTLSVKDADGKVVVNGRGGVIGRLRNGQVTIKDPNPNDGTGPIVNGADSTASLPDHTTRYSGANVRFRIIGGAFTVTVNGNGIDMSVIGRGLVTMDGYTGTDGTYTLNGDAAEEFPVFRFTFPLTAPTGAGG
jgi:hypothetical protein